MMSTNGKVSDLLIIMLIKAPLAPTAGVLFTPKNILSHSLSLFKNVALIILSKTENHKDDVSLKIYALIWVLLFCYLNLQHRSSRAESTLLCCAWSCQRSELKMHLEKRMFKKVLHHVYIKIISMSHLAPLYPTIGVFSKRIQEIE